MPDWHFAETWQRYRGLPVKERVAELLSMTEHKIFMHYKRELRPEERRKLREAIRSMVRRTSLRAAYKGLFDWMGRPELFKPAAGKFEYADVFPLIHLKMRLERLDNPYGEVKHLLVDEMQDYTPLQYAVLAALFPCRKTILGDITQAVQADTASDAAQIQRVLKATAPAKLTRSYRSTWEIMRFALGISPNDELIPLERHGEEPEIISVRSEADQADRTAREIRDLERSDHRSLAIIAKTQDQAEKLHRRLAKTGLEVRLLKATSGGISSGAVVCAAHLAKGLEFDRVIVADASDRNYRSETDRNLLYIACTRAMHRLTLLCVGEASGLLPKRAAA